MSASTSRAIVYLRQSSSRQEQSLEDQLRWAIEEAGRRGIALDVNMEMLDAARRGKQHNVGDLYLDDAITGSDMSRPGFKAFHRRAVSDRAVTHCMFWARDRFARANVALDAARLEADIRHAGKHVVVATGASLGPRQSHENNMVDDLTLVMEYGVASNFRPELAKKVVRALDRNASSGLACGGRPPYGFVRAQFNRTTGQVDKLLERHLRVGPGYAVVLVPGTDEESCRKLDVVRRIHALYHSGLRGLHMIAKQLNEEGIPSPDAGRTRVGRPVPGKWTVGTVRSILEQPLYMGEVTWGRRAEGNTIRYDASATTRFRGLTDGDRDAATGKVRKLVFRERELWTKAQSAAKYPPIVDPDVWLQNYERLRVKGQVGQKRGVSRCADPNKYPLDVICGSCGARMAGMPYRGKPSYVCSTYTNSHRTECAHNWVWRDFVVAFAVNHIRAIVERADSREKLRDAIRSVYLREQSQEPAGDRQVAELRAKEERLRQEAREAHRELIRIRAADRTEGEIARETYDEIIAQLKDVSRQIRELDAALPAASDLDAEVDKAEAMLKELHLFVARVPNSRLRDLFTALGAQLAVRFEHRPGKLRQHVPVAGELTLGTRGKLHLPIGEIMKAVAPQPRAMPAATTPINGPADPGIRANGTLPSGWIGRGDRI